MFFSPSILMEGFMMSMRFLKNVKQNLWKTVHIHGTEASSVGFVTHTRFEYWEQPPSHFFGSLLSLLAFISTVVKW